MADIFISYTRADRERIVPLARSLEARGYTVWWDLELVPSQKFERQIKRELEAARCVIVVWTERSVGDDGMYVSEWVQIEAHSGDQRGILLPVQFDPGRTHWRHSQNQFAALHGWTGDESVQGFIALLRGVELLAGVRERPVDRELRAWQAAELAESAEVFRRFLAEFPQSRFADVARGRGVELDELAAWNSLGPAPTMAGLMGFVRDYPIGRFARDAEAKATALELASAQQSRAEPPSASARNQPTMATSQPQRPRWRAAAGVTLLAVSSVLVFQLWPTEPAEIGSAATDTTTTHSDTSSTQRPPITTLAERVSARDSASDQAPAPVPQADKPSPPRRPSRYAGNSALLSDLDRRMQRNLGEVAGFTQTDDVVVYQATLTRHHRIASDSLEGNYACRYLRPNRGYIVPTDFFFLPDPVAWRIAATRQDQRLRTG